MVGRTTGWGCGGAPWARLHVAVVGIPTHRMVHGAAMSLRDSFLTSGLSDGGPWPTRVWANHRTTCRPPWASRISFLTQGKKRSPWLDP